ncbi:hypothetical protein AWJ20_3423 [Sugiyamaella lignohabitans]|uniref:Zn(2)-C6 fungal-type domain-containing protein n=1 Tax=Sugiyamaella lignohabitans TaxID=796027 RepID=A0A167FW69_9ASCO|nr:uncharacterized protein AWJ20_3423 [Sugiyamaella lignohabitans]ANB15779.1 hypothetical protein AWJ20_3423 [Sugiyamaella lignohabitans]
MAGANSIPRQQGFVFHDIKQEVDRSSIPGHASTDDPHYTPLPPPPSTPQWSAANNNNSKLTTGTYSNNAGEDSSKKQVSQKKRPLACVNCRYSKLKCQFSSTAEPRTCDRCRLQGVVCKVEGRSEERQHFEEFSSRLSRVEDLLDRLIGKIEASYPPAVPPEHSLPPVHAQETAVSLQKRHSSSASLGNGTSIPQSPASSVSTSTLSSPVVLKNNPVIWRKRDRKPGGTAKELLSELNNNTGGPPSPGPIDYQDEEPPSLPAKRIKLTPEAPGRDLIDRGLINASEADECLMFFSTNISRYLPVLVLNYVVYFDSSVRQRSPLLFASVLAVASLYHPSYRNRHRVFRKEFETLAEKMDRPRIDLLDSNANSQHDIQPLLDDILALIIAGAWIGGELGFRASLVASEMFGYLLPKDPQNYRFEDQTRSMLGAIGLVTYIIEKRLRIIHDRPSQLPPDALSNRRDQYLPVFLSGLSGNLKPLRSIDPSELKATANVELCTLMMMYQQELSHKVEAHVMTHWNTQLDKWLSEWMGKLTTHLKPSTWKPLMLTFHYAKLFLNLRIIQDTTPSVEENTTSADGTSATNLLEAGFIHFVTLAEKAALDVLNMLVFDEDIQRMVRVGPVFYPTIFVTAGAFLLKLLCIGPIIRYHVNEDILVSMVAQATARLEESLASDILPCYVTVRNLGDALTKVVKILESTGRYSADGTLSTNYDKLSTDQKDTKGQSSDRGHVPNGLNIVHVPLPMDSTQPVPPTGHNIQTSGPFEGQPILASANYQWSFVSAYSQPLQVQQFLPVPPAHPPPLSQGQPRLVPEGMEPLLHPEEPVPPSPPQPLPTNGSGQWPLGGEGFRNVYNSDPNFLMDAHSTNLLQSLFESQFMNGS